MKDEIGLKGLFKKDPIQVMGSLADVIIHMDSHMVAALEAGEAGEGKELLGNLGALSYELNQLLPQINEKFSEFDTWEDVDQFVAEEWPDEDDGTMPDRE